MSRTTKSISNSRSAKGGFNKVAPKPFCPHCKNLGLDESVYTSHFVRENSDPSSKVVCPELLSTECPYCFKPGHTKSRCPILIARETQRKKEEKKQLYADNIQKKHAEEMAKKEQKKAKQVNKFTALLESDDSDDEKPVKAIQKQKNKQATVEQFPALPSKPKVEPTMPNQPTNSYAGVTAKPKQEILEKPELIRSQAFGYSTILIPKNAFWDEFDSEKEDEREFAARKLEEELAIEEHKQKLFSLKASDVSWDESDSDDEDW